MKRFVKNTILFVVVCMMLIFTITFTLFVTVKKHADFRLKEHPVYLVVGHSHPECAFNDSLISGLKNISKSGEACFYSYQKLKTVLNQNPSIKTVFIEFTNNQIEEEMDRWTWDNKHITRYPDFVPFMSNRDKALLFKHNGDGFLNLVSISARYALLRIVTNDYNYEKQLGGYQFLVQDITDSVLRILNKKETDNHKKPVTISETNLNYLSAMIHYCKRHHVEPVLIRSPLHKGFFRFVDERAYKNILKKRFSDVTWLDFSSFPIKDSGFADPEHLNYKGARVFSLWFNEILKKGLLSKSDKARFVKKEISERAHRTINNP